jgi:hypothetical protein
MEEEIDHIVLVTKHPNQPCYSELFQRVAKVTFLNPEDATTEKDFLASLNLPSSKHTAVLFDDVSSFPYNSKNTSKEVLVLRWNRKKSKDSWS